MKDAINTPSKTLGEFKRAYGKDWVIGYLSMWLIELNDNANVKMKMTDGQMEDTAERIYDTYSLKVTDLTLFFRNVKDGVYGPFYENLSRDKIMQWLAMYFDERCEMAEMTNSRNHEKFSLVKDPINPEVAKKMFEGVGEEKVDSVQYEKNTIGKRLKESIDTPEGYVPPIQKRSVYLGLLKEVCNKSSRAELESSRLNLIEKGTEPDALEVIESEMKNRGIL